MITEAAVQGAHLAIDGDNVLNADTWDSRSNALQSVEGGDRTEIEDVTNAGRHDAFGSEIAVRGRLLQRGRERDDMLAKRVPLPREFCGLTPSSA